MVRSEEHGVTAQGKDFSAWYNEVVAKAQLVDRGPVKGTMVIRPYGYRLWELLQSDGDARFDAELQFDGAAVAPRVTWGTSPEQSIPIDGVVPHPDEADNPSARSSCERALGYMGVKPGDSLDAIYVDQEGSTQTASVTLASGPPR